MKSGGFRRPSILADTMEAIFGAIFVDSGFDAARQAIGKLFDPVLKTVDPKTLGKDSKTLLQEYLQGKRIALPVYTVVETARRRAQPGVRGRVLDSQARHQRARQRAQPPRPPSSRRRSRPSKRPSTQWRLLGRRRRKKSNVPAPRWRSDRPSRPTAMARRRSRRPTRPPEDGTMEQDAPRRVGMVAVIGGPYVGVHPGDALSASA